MTEREQRYIQDPLFWRAGAIAATIFRSMVLAAITIDTLRQITPGSPRVPAYDVINNSIAYQYDPARAEYAPKIGGEELIFDAFPALGNMSQDLFWWWWLVHLWVEATWEVLIGCIMACGP